MPLTNTEESVIKGVNMNNTAVMTDTNSGITPSQAERFGIYLVPMPVLVNEKIYFEGVNLTHGQLYSMMKEGAELTTSQPDVSTITGMWDDILRTHDDLVYIPMSSGLSGSLSTAKALAADYNGRVRVADTHRISVTMLHCALDAVFLAKQGRNAEEIVQILEETAFDSVIYLGVDTLKYLRKSGRVTAGAAAVASILNIKPILITEGGKFDTFAKVRGLKACKEKLIETGIKELEGRFAKFDREHLRVSTAGTFETAEDEESWRAQVQEAFPQFRVEYDKLSCSIACHTGIGSLGIAVYSVLHDYTEIK